MNENHSSVTSASKKPVPTPRKSVVAKATEVVKEDKNEGTNTFSRRVSKSTKQIAGDLNQLVQDRKKAVIHGTRESVRRIRSRFSSYSEESGDKQCNNNNSISVDETDNIDIFHNIKFESPLSRSSSIYNNVEDNSSNHSSNESLNLPPPSHPPPPLPQIIDEGHYDAPQSLTSSTSSSSQSSSNKKSNLKSSNYEYVFPVKDDNSGQLSRSCSWKFYDTAHENNADEVVVRNSLYENHEIVTKCNNMSRPSKSVILQFDPLLSNEATSNNMTPQYDMKLLEKLLQEDIYSNMSEVRSIEDWSVSNESESDDFINPPTPPTRFDSLPEDENIEETREDTSTKVVPKKRTTTPETQSKTNWFTNEEKLTTAFEQRKSSHNNWFKQVKGVLEKAPEVLIRGNKSNENLVERPTLGAKISKQKRGMLYKVQNGPVEDLFGEYSARWCVLDNSNFVCYSDNSCMHLKEHFPAENVLSIQILQDTKYKYRYDNDDLHCFELNVTGKTRGGHIYGSKNLSERRVWVQLLAESLTSRLKSTITSNFNRMGWAYVREGVSGQWLGAWVVLSERELHYAIDNQPIKTMDLRKARCIVLHAYEENDVIPKTNDRGPNMLVDCPEMALYLRMWTSRETKVWCHIVKLEAHNNGARLDQQQLTKNDIPVIVEKCVNFVYAHGSMTEGIYRKTGTGSAVSELLSKFRKDAFSVQLTTDNASDHLVASALKRFFRDLPEPLLGCDHRLYLHEVSKHNHQDEKIRMFKAALEQLTPIYYKTARKLLGHLHFISSQCIKNRMTVENLAAIWGPSLMHYEDENQKHSSMDHQLDSEVIKQLIKMYRYIFPEDPDELEKEKIMLKVLQRHVSSPQGVAKKTAGDFRVWIYLHNNDGKSYNVAIGPNKTAYDICVELKDKIQMEVHEITLEEVVLNSNLVRPIHHSEKVLDVVLNWSYWDEQDRKDNYITLVKLSKYWEFIIEKPFTVSGDLKFAENKSKTFKNYTFQFTQGKLTCFKDKTGETILHTWRIEDIVWYLGHEPKRNPQTRWSMTFLEKNMKPNRSKSVPYFGHCVAWQDASSRANWLSAMLKARYPNNLAPPPNFLE